MARAQGTNKNSLFAQEARCEEGTHCPSGHLYLTIIQRRESIGLKMKSRATRDRRENWVRLTALAY